MIVTSSVALKGAVVCYTKRSPCARKFASGSALFMLTDQINQSCTYSFKCLVSLTEISADQAYLHITRSNPAYSMTQVLVRGEIRKPQFWAGNGTSLVTFMQYYKLLCSFKKLLKPGIAHPREIMLFQYQYLQKTKENKTASIKMIYEIGIFQKLSDT